MSDMISLEAAQMLCDECSLPIPVCNMNAIISDTVRRCGIGALRSNSLVQGMISDAISDRPAMQVAVKALTWFEVEKSRHGGKYTADGYTIRYIEGLWILYFAGDSKTYWRFPTLEAAKAAAQADYEARIRSALIGGAP